MMTMIIMKTTYLVPFLNQERKFPSFLRPQLKLNNQVRGVVHTERCQQTFNQHPALISKTVQSLRQLILTFFFFCPVIDATIHRPIDICHVISRYPIWKYTEKRKERRAVSTFPISCA